MIKRSMRMRQIALCTTATMLVSTLIAIPERAWAAETAYAYTGMQQTHTVGDGVKVAKFVVTGAGGGGFFQPGGAGAIVTSYLAVTPGQSLAVKVGGGGPITAGGAATSVTGTSPTVTLVAGGGGGGRSSAGGNAGNADGSGNNGGGSTPGLGAPGPVSGNGGAGGNNGGAGGTSSTPDGGAGGAGAGGGGGFAGGGSGGAGSDGAHGGGSVDFSRGGFPRLGGGGAGFGGGGGGGGSGAGAGGGGGYGGGGGSYFDSGGGAGGSYASSAAVGAQSTTFAPGSNGGAAQADGGDGSVVVTELAQPEITSIVAAPGGAVVEWVEPPQPIGQTVTYRVYVGGAPVTGATSSPTTVTGYPVGTPITVSVVASTAAGLRTDSDPSSVTPLGGAAQTVTCINGTGTVNAAGNKVLTKPGCKSSANKVVGTALAVARLRGDVRAPRLICRVGSRLVAPKPLPASYGRKSMRCKQGAMLVQTFNRKGRYTVTWTAPATPSYKAYKKVYRFVIR